MYTREEIMSMSAGHELDAIITTAVMGFDQCDTDSPYSTDIAAAWEVVEELQSRGIYIDIRTCADFYEAQALEYIIDRHFETVADPSISLAICRCALLTLIKED